MSKMLILVPAIRYMNRLFYCETFKSLPVKDRIDVVKRHHLCENCLLGNHNVDSCFKTSTCSVPGCDKKHKVFTC